MTRKHPYPTVQAAKQMFQQPSHHKLSDDDRAMAEKFDVQIEIAKAEEIRRNEEVRRTKTFSKMISRLKSEPVRIYLRDLGLGHEFILCRTGERFTLVERILEGRRLSFICLGTDGRRTALNHQCLVSPIHFEKRKDGEVCGQ